jgi:hypothetical protein
LSGVVDSVAAGVTDVSIGDEVYAPLSVEMAGQLIAQVPTASTCTSKARQAMSRAAARMDAGGT